MPLNSGSDKSESNLRRWHRNRVEEQGGVRVNADENPGFHGEMNCENAKK